MKLINLNIEKYIEMGLAFDMHNADFRVLLWQYFKNL